MEEKAVEMFRKQMAYWKNETIRQEIWFQKNKERVLSILVGLSKFKIIFINTVYYLNIAITGTKKDLNEIFHILRTLGYLPDDRPKENQAEFKTFWRHQQDENFSFGLDFASTQCRKIQVGTETKEIPIYETICDETPEVKNIFEEA